MSIEVEAKKLQDQLAGVDLLSRSGSNGIEFLVLKLDDLKIKMYQEQGHATPHVHIDYGQFHHVASYSIKSGERLAGLLESKYDKKIKEWIERNKEILESLWSECQKGNSTELLIANIRKKE